MYERWERARKANHEVVQLLRQKSARRAGPPGRASREAAEASNSCMKMGLRALRAWILEFVEGLLS